MVLQEKGFIFKPTGEFDWSRTHAQVPFAYPMENNVRVFFSTRDQFSHSCVSFVDVKKSDPRVILHPSDKPAIERGKQGSFDDSGVMPSWFIKQGNELWMYYTAWNKSESASYRLSIGLARSFDDGVTFERMFDGPIMDRDKHDPIWVGQPCVMKLSDQDWRMWYLSCQKIEVIDNKPEPFYCVKYATSTNGIDWKRTENVCIDFDGQTDAIGRPCVWFKDNFFHMLHSNRQAIGYRSEKNNAYRIEHSRSVDGISWENTPGFMPFHKSDTGWDSIMNEYCTVYEENGFLFVLYNGNGFGESGFGYAKFKV